MSTDSTRNALAKITSSLSAATLRKARDKNERDKTDSDRPDKEKSDKGDKKGGRLSAEPKRRPAAITTNPRATPSGPRSGDLERENGDTDDLPTPAFSPGGRALRFPAVPDEPVSTSPFPAKENVLLPPELAAHAANGYRFSTAPAYLRAIAGGFVHRRTGGVGVGIWWSDTGGAADDNLGEGYVEAFDEGAAGLLAVIRTIETCPFPHLPLEIDTGDAYVWTTVSETLHQWQSKWHDTTFGGPNRRILSHLIVLLREREQPVRFKFICGHHGSAAAFELARAAGSKPARMPVPIQWKSADEYVDKPPRKAKHVSIIRSIMI